MNIYEVAKEAGVSPATVSRVLNNSAVVKAETRERVLRVIQHMNFRPNAIAQGLANRKMKTIGILTTNIRDLYFSTAIYTLVRIAQERGFDTLLSHVKFNGDAAGAAIDLLMDKCVDGIVLIGSIFMDAACKDQLIAAAERVPVVMLNGQSSLSNVFSIFCKDDEGEYEATRHLLAGGRKRLVFLYDVNTNSAFRKQDGYCRAMKEYGLEPAFCKTEGKGSIEGGAEAAEKLVRMYPDLDGVICTEDLMAAGVLNTLRNKGISVPHQIAVIGYNDLMVPMCTYPPLASVDGKVRKLAALSFESIYHVLEHEDTPKVVSVAPEFILRESALCE